MYEDCVQQEQADGRRQTRGEGADDDGCAHAARVLQLVREVRDVDAGVCGWCCKGR